MIFKSKQQIKLEQENKRLTEKIERLREMNQESLSRIKDLEKQLEAKQFVILKMGKYIDDNDLLMKLACDEACILIGMDPLPD